MHGIPPLPPPEDSALRAAEDLLEASAGALILPGAMHRIRNLLFRATCHLQATPAAQASDEMRAAGAALEQVRRLLDLLEWGGEHGRGSTSVESASLVLEQLREFLAPIVKDRGLGLAWAVGPGLPPLALAPARALRWCALALRCLLERVPEGLRGEIRVDGTARAGRVALTLRFLPARGFLPLVCQAAARALTDLDRVARQEGIAISAPAGPRAQVDLELPGAVANPG